MNWHMNWIVLSALVISDHQVLRWIVLLSGTIAVFAVFVMGIQHQGLPLIGLSPPRIGLGVLK